MSCKYTLPGLLPSGPLLYSPMELRADERELFDLWAQEHVEIAGVEIEYFHYDRAGSTMDPVYNEPVHRKFLGPFKFKAHFTFPDNFPEAREEGLRTQWNATLWIPRLTIEQAHAPEPDEGDVFRIWDLPFFRSWGVQDDNVPKAGFYFEATNSDPNGTLFDQPAFVGFTIEVTRRSEYTAERFLRSQ